MTVAITSLPKPSTVLQCVGKDTGAVIPLGQPDRLAEELESLCKPTSHLGHGVEERLYRDLMATNGELIPSKIPCGGQVPMMQAGNMSSIIARTKERCGRGRDKYEEEHEMERNEACGVEMCWCGEDAREGGAALRAMPDPKLISKLSLDELTRKAKREEIAGLVVFTGGRFGNLS
jgi:hypothetical protein